jgi:hypothetical protein
MLPMYHVVIGTGTSLKNWKFKADSIARNARRSVIARNRSIPGFKTGTFFASGFDFRLNIETGKFWRPVFMSS